MINAKIDGKNITTCRGTTILEAANQNNISIPTLCGKNKSGEKIPCDLCVVEVEGQDSLLRSCEIEVTEHMSITTRSEKISEHRKAALTTILSDHYADCEAPCQSACPAGIDVQSYLAQIALGNHHEAVKIIKEKLPMPLSIGRVCPAFCETECRRNLVDDSLAIRQLKRHAADFDLGDEWQWIPEKGAPKGKKIAIVGSGPAGLTCGYYLSNDGYDVTVFESAEKAGGWLRYGIPEYRLPKDILDQEIELMCRNGMKIELGKKLGTDFTLKDLNKDFDVIYLAIGAQKAVPMNYPGSDLKGCYLGVDYLRDYVTDKKMVTGQKVAVIGGGNTAIDCARTAVRDGADVTLIYRRTRAEMPAEPYEIEEAELEGVKFHFLTNPAQNIADENGHVCRIKFEKMELGEADSSGRRRPQATGEFFEEAFDTVIPAVSQTPDVAFLDHEENKTESGEIPLTKWSTAEACDETMYVGIENIFAIGDFRRGPATAVEAIADGRKAAVAIEHFFGGKLHDEKIETFNSRKEKSIKHVDSKQYNHFKKESRKHMAELSLKEREKNFAEVELGFNEDDALIEAARCIECGCQVNTTCKLRDYATDYGITNETLYSDERQKFDVDNTSEFIVFDANRCISCGQCVETCNNMSAHDVISFNQSDPSKRITFNAGEKMGHSSCVQCGNCVQECPVGALVFNKVKSQGRTNALKEVSTICTYCGVGCSLTYHVDEEKNKVEFVTGTPESPVNQGMLCVKGRFGYDFINSEERLTSPLIKEDGKFREASWEEAIQKVAEKFNGIISNNGANAIAGFSSAKTTNEDNYAFQKFLRREVGTNNVDHCARLCHASTVTGLDGAFGSGAMTNDIPSIQDSDLIFIIGSDTTAAHPIIASHIKQVVKSGKARLIVADPKEIKIADHANLYVAQRPGTDVMLVNGIMQQIIQNGWEDTKYIAERIEGYDALKAEVMKEAYSLENVEAVTGIAKEDVKKIAQMIGTAKHTAVYYSMGITQHTTGVDNVRSLANLQMLCGNLGVSGAGINPLRGQSNVQGACDMGALPNVFPGYQKLLTPGVVEKFEEAWDKKGLSREIGLTITEVIDGICDDSVKALYVMGENPVLSDPDQKHVIQALEKIDFLVVQDIFMTETAEYADVVLPAYSFAEKSGHFTNTERRVQRLHPVVKAPGDAKEDWEIIQMIANAMTGHSATHEDQTTSLRGHRHEIGNSNWMYRSVEEITSELCSVTPQYTGITWERVGDEGIQWPCPTSIHPGTPILHTEKFVRGKGEMKAVEFRYAAELPCQDYPLAMTTGRLLEQFHTGTMTRKTKGLNNLAGPRVMVSVDDAEAMGIENGEVVKVSTKRGSIETNAFVTKKIQKGVIFIPFHFQEAPANRLTISEVDPYAKIPEFKVCAAKIEKL